MKIAWLILLSVLISFSGMATETKTDKPSIIALAPHIVEVLFEIGVGEQIIGTTEFADYPDAAKNIPVVGNYLGLQVEAILAMQPDLIIAWKSGNPAAQLARLEKMGLKIIYSNPAKLVDIPNEMRMFGNNTGNAELAHKVASAFDMRLASIKKKHGNHASLRVFYELWPNPLTTVAQGSWNHNVLSVCGVQNVFAEAASAFPQVNIEQVLSKQVQVIVQPVSKSEVNKSGYDWHKWELIPAVKQQRIIRPNADRLHRMSSRVLDELEWLCQQLPANADTTR